jgi:hypothetical protein
MDGVVVNADAGWQTRVALLAGLRAMVPSLTLFLKCNLIASLKK